MPSNNMLNNLKKEKWLEEGVDVDNINKQVSINLGPGKAIETNDLVAFMQP